MDQPRTALVNAAAAEAGAPPSAHRNPVVFVVGCPRSGTTLLQRMLDGHPSLAVANDTHFIPRALKGYDRGVNPPLTPDVVDRVRGYHRFRRLGVPDEGVARAAARGGTYRDFVSALYDEFGRMHGKPLAGEKTPDYVRSLPYLHDLFEWARSIHIIRDGRDVALSTLDWARDDKGPGRLALWAEEPVATCALWWRWNVHLGRRDGAALGSSRYREVSYETLVASPEPTLRDLASFLDLPYDEGMSRFHAGKTRQEPGLSAKKAWLPPTKGLRDWRTDLVGRDLELFEALAGDLLSALGYERAVDTVSDEVTAVAERCREWWESEKGPMLPIVPLSVS
jgi:hypothetical protein